MTKITITIPDDHMPKLQEIAARFQVSPEDLLRVSLEEILARPDKIFQRTLKYVLQKNAELYERLA